MTGLTQGLPLLLPEGDIRGIAKPNSGVGPAVFLSWKIYLQGYFIFPVPEVRLLNELKAVRIHAPFELPISEYSVKA